MNINKYEEIGKLIREIRSNRRCIKRYFKENDEMLEKLNNLLISNGDGPVTLEDVFESDEEDSGLL